MKKWLGIALCLTVLVVLSSGVIFWQAMEGPLYEPGMVRAGKNLRAPLAPPEQPLGGSYWQVEEDIQLFYEARGEGRPILFVHGGPGFPHEGPWTGLEGLTDEFRFYHYHQRGCGKSSRPIQRFESNNYYQNMVDLERTLGIGAQVADIERIRRILGEDKLLLIGHSFGGFLAAMYAAEFPERVEALILVAPAGVLVLPDKEADLYARVRNRLPPEQRPEYDEFVKEYFDFGSIFSRSEKELAKLNRQNGRYLLAALGESLPKDDPDSEPQNGGWMVQAMYFSMGKRHDYRGSLANVSAPVLIVHGEEDDLFLGGSRSYADCFPNATFCVLKGEKTHQSRAGHFLLNDQPDSFAAAAGQFLEDVLKGHSRQSGGG